MQELVNANGKHASSTFFGPQKPESGIDSPDVELRVSSGEAVPACSGATIVELMTSMSDDKKRHGTAIAPDRSQILRLLADVENMDNVRMNVRLTSEFPDPYTVKAQ